MQHLGARLSLVVLLCLVAGTAAAAAFRVTVDGSSPLATLEQAVAEAGRCMSCGMCFECDNCYGVCPDNAVTKLGPGKRFEFKYDYCKGCSLCATECPCGAIQMVPEEI